MHYITYRLPIVFLCGALSGISYLTSLAPTITWAHGSSDSGELVTAAYYLGVAHPTGYPLYVVLGWLFSHLSLGTVAFRVNLLSAVAASLAIALLASVLLLRHQRRSAYAQTGGALVGALFLAFSPLFWSQAIVTEVYALNALFVVLLLHFHEQLSSDHPRNWITGLAGLTLGLGMANHVTLVLMAPSLAIAILGRSSGGRAYNAVLLLVGLLVGVSLYGLLPIFAASAPSFASWGDIRSPEAFVDHITGIAYRVSLFSLPVNLVVSRVPALARMLLEQFGWAGYLLAIMGVWSMTVGDRAYLLSWAVSVVLYLGFALNYPVLDSQVYLLPFFVLVAVAIGWGTVWLLEQAIGKFPARSIPSVALVLALLLLITGSFVTSRPAVDASNDWEAHHYAQSTLDTLSTDAVLITNEDRESFSLWYLQYVEGYRRDVILVDARLLSWPWYQRNLSRTYPELNLPALPLAPLQEIMTVVTNNVRSRPVYLTFDSSLPTARDGELRRVDPSRVG